MIETKQKLLVEVLLIQFQEHNQQQQMLGGYPMFRVLLQYVVAVQQ